MSEREKKDDPQEIVIDLTSWVFAMLALATVAIVIVAIMALSMGRK